MQALEIAGGEFAQPAFAASWNLQTDLFSSARCARNIVLDGAVQRAYVRSVPLTEGVSGDEPESERDAASCVHGS